MYYGGSLQYMAYNGQAVYFTHAPDGTPMGMLTEGNAYFYITNLQGDVVGILDAEGDLVVSYSYDAWGNPLSCTGSLASTIGALNPLRYRCYVYDTETQLYYLQSRYYDPEIGRFINADAFASTGQGFTGNNMFAYCGNNPVAYEDDAGNMRKPCTVAINDDGILGQKHFGTTNSADAAAYAIQSEQAYLRKGLNYLSNDSAYVASKATGIAFYNGVPIIKVPSMKNSAFSFGIIFMGYDSDENLVKHEYGHVVHMRQIGIFNYLSKVFVPSAINYWDKNRTGDYFSQPWEYIADYLGKVNREDHEYEENAPQNATWYWLYTLLPG